LTELFVKTNRALVHFPAIGQPYQGDGSLIDTFGHYAHRVLQDRVPASLYNKPLVNSTVDAMKYSGFAPPDPLPHSKLTDEPMDIYPAGLRYPGYFDEPRFDCPVRDLYATREFDYDITFDDIDGSDITKKMWVTWITPGKSPKNGNLLGLLKNFGVRVRNKQIHGTGSCLRVTFRLPKAVNPMEAQDNWLEQAVYMRIGRLITATRPAHVVLVVEGDSYAQRFDAVHLKEAGHFIASLCYNAAKDEDLNLEVELIPHRSHGVSIVRSHTI
jgi:hypothetical protein